MEEKENEKNSIKEENYWIIFGNNERNKEISRIRKSNRREKERNNRNLFE